MKTPVMGNVIRIDARSFVIDEGDAICTYSREYYRLAYDLEQPLELVYGLHAIAKPRE